MKTQIIKIIPCLLAGFILSACVGAVNLPAGAIAEDKTETSESETQTPKKLVIKEPEPQNKKVVEPVEPKPITEVEPKPIIAVEPKPISANPCITNPFGDTCGGEEFNDAREGVCLTERESHRCRVIIPLVCEADSLDKLCAGDETYYPAQYATCESEPNSERCALTIARVCRADSLDRICNGLTAYYSAQKAACEGVSSNRCTPTIRRICNADVLDAFCNGRRVYYRTQELTCASKPNSLRCAPTIVRVCGTDSLNALCAGNKIYYLAQKIACASESKSSRCAPIVERACRADVLDVLCIGLTAYFMMQETICANEPNSKRCAPTRARLCPETPFDMLCQSNNLTRDDIQVPSDIIFGSIIGNSPNGNCSYSSSTNSSSCHGNIPSIIDIKPLNNTNTGTATYTGSVSLQYPAFFSSGSNITKNIDIRVNFYNKTLTYDGILDSVYNYTFSINGNFTDRGQITGSVKFRTAEGDLIGLIGQNEAIGVFTGRRYNKGLGVTARNRAFGGGFRVFRE